MVTTRVFFLKVGEKKGGMNTPFDWSKQAFVCGYGEISPRPFQASRPTRVQVAPEFDNGHRD